MATVFALLLIAGLIGAFWLIYTRSKSVAGSGQDEEDLQRFLVANRELRLDRVDNELWATAMRLAHGDDGVARARYISLRVQQMKAQAEAKAEAEQQQ